LLHNCLSRAVIHSFQIVLWGRTEKCLKETTEEIRQLGTECHYFICDVGNREEVYQTAKAVREKVSTWEALCSVQWTQETPDKEDILVWLWRELCLWWMGFFWGTFGDLQGNRSKLPGQGLSVDGTAGVAPHFCCPLGNLPSGKILLMIPADSLG
jgi:hypothetical protein